MKVSVLPAADIEAADAAVWYDDQREGLGDEFLAEWQAALDHIRNAPEQLSKLEGYAGRHEIRRYLMRRFPYIVIFVRRTADLVVVAVSHTRRRPQYWLERLGSN